MEVIVKQGTYRHSLAGGTATVHAPRDVRLGEWERPLANLVKSKRREARNAA